MRHRPELTGHIIRCALEKRRTAACIYWELYKLGWTDEEMAAGFMAMLDGGE